MWFSDINIILGNGRFRLYFNGTNSRYHPSLKDCVLTLLLCIINNTCKLVGEIIRLRCTIWSNIIFIFTLEIENALHIQKFGSEITEQPTKRRKLSEVLRDVHSLKLAMDLAMEPWLCRKVITILGRDVEVVLLLWCGHYH